MRIQKIICFLSIVIILLTIATTTVGLFWEDDGKAFYLENVNGDKVKIFGNGLYAHESYFQAPINKGTDAIILFIVIPAFFICILMYSKNLYKIKLLHLGFLSCLLYYSASIAFGISYNILFLVYLILFSVCLFTFIISVGNIEHARIEKSIMLKFPHRSIAIFLSIAGLSVFVWLIEIIGSIKTGTFTDLGINTTEPTFILDIGIIAPCAFLSAFLVTKRKALGYIFGIALITLNSIIGLIVISQTIFQNLYGIGIGLDKFIPYVVVFVIMSLVATVLNIKALSSIEN